ncbi:hypothetical protein V498_03065 [Pseudogymnoascus sp. VKM F-4517 (FW-2822)]|nr:hypothetical protein V498_03065 [Pseudogymnoascus sp. VKM F-4517 (FW-2822)]
MLPMNPTQTPKHHKNPTNAQNPRKCHKLPAPQREIPALQPQPDPPSPPQPENKPKSARPRKQTRSPTAPHHPHHTARTTPPAQSLAHLPAATKIREPKEPIPAGRRTFSQEAIGSEHHFLTLRTTQKNPCRPNRRTPSRNPEIGGEETSTEINTGEPGNNFQVPPHQSERQ